MYSLSVLHINLQNLKTRISEIRIWLTEDKYSFEPVYGLLSRLSNIFLAFNTNNSMELIAIYTVANETRLFPEVLSISLSQEQRLIS